MTNSQLGFPMGKFPHLPVVCLIDPEIPFRSPALLEEITKAGFTPATKDIAAAVHEEFPKLQRENPIVVLGERTIEEGEEKVLVYPMIGTAAYGDTTKAREGVYVTTNGKWEKHARFLVVKNPPPPPPAPPKKSLWDSVRALFS